MNINHIKNMDKKTLNNEVVLCRGAVRKAKVAIIRKIVKKMKILKACKVEAMKEKKLKKAERLFKKVQMMKRLKVDEVTKFALRNKDLEPFLKGPKPDLRQNSLASLAGHDAVVKRINSIRERIPNWETELPRLLDSLGKKKRKKDNIQKEPIKTDDKNDKKSVECKASEKIKKVETVRKTKSPRITQNKNPTDSEESDDSTSEKVEKVEKIDDPFFIGKKIIAPKLLLESLSEENTVGKPRKPTVKRNEFHEKPFKTKKVTKVEAQPEEEKLHPSWAAKKVKLIKPFQGKKITFSDD